MTARAKEFSRRIHPAAELSEAIDAIERLGGITEVRELAVPAKA